MTERAIPRRSFLLSSGKAATAAAVAASGLRPQRAAGNPILTETRPVRVLNPRGRIPLSFIIDDSTCLVNMGHFCMPQFAEAWPERDIYRKPWKSWPREIPDSFVREFGEWCGEHGVKGKYSVVPFPACVGWLDRELPGWPRKELQSSLKLVRELMVPNWDIHPELITHTRVIDISTGRPLDVISAATMENSFPQEKKSVDELAAYLAYALRILRNCDLPCTGITTPGGFGTLVKSELSLAVREAVREVYGAEVPHYFKYVSEGDESTEPVLEHVLGKETRDLRLTVNIPAGTGDWFGGWDGDREPEPERYISLDSSSGRLIELIERGQPGTFLCHWPGMYGNGSKKGFAAFKHVVTALDQQYGKQTVWMKLSEIARYWAAKELTEITPGKSAIMFSAPVSSPLFTIDIPEAHEINPKLQIAGNAQPLVEVSGPDRLNSMTWFRETDRTLVCFDLPKGESTILLS